jgi:hypothetical protein
MHRSIGTAGTPSWSARILGDPPTCARAIIDGTVVVSGCPGFRRRARSLSTGVSELPEDATVRVHDGHLEATFGSLDQNALHVIVTHRCAVPHGVYTQTRARMAIRRAQPIRYRQGTARAGDCAAACRALQQWRAWRSTRNGAHIFIRCCKMQPTDGNGFRPKAEQAVAQHDSADPRPRLRAPSCAGHEVACTSPGEMRAVPLARACVR